MSELSGIWTVVFEEAWSSFRAGSFGVGAALADPADDSIVSVGRNRVAQPHAELRTLSGNMTAHAEMNAFAGLDRFNAAGLHLYTTLQPCLMCAATAMQLKVAHVNFAASDEFFVGMDELWQRHPVTAERAPDSTGPLPGRLGRFARLLPMVFTLRHFPGRSAEQQARRAHPDLATIADRLITDDELAGTVRSATLAEGLDLLVGPAQPTFS